MFFVYGGEWTSTKWIDLVPDTYQEFGPYKTYKEALIKWKEISMKWVDVCHRRYLITPKGNE